jgi:hypothetical protein
VVPAPLNHVAKSPRPFVVLAKDCGNTPRRYLLMTAGRLPGEDRAKRSLQLAFATPSLVEVVIVPPRSRPIKARTG